MRHWGIRFQNIKQHTEKLWQNRVKEQSISIILLLKFIWGTLKIRKHDKKEMTRTDKKLSSQGREKNPESDDTGGTACNQRFEKV